MIVRRVALRLVWSLIYADRHISPVPGQVTPNEVIDRQQALRAEHR